MKKYLKYRRRYRKWRRKWSWDRFIQRAILQGGHWNEGKTELHLAPGKYTESFQFAHGVELIGITKDDA